MGNEYTRRDFVQIMSAGAGALLLGPQLDSTRASAEAADSSSQMKLGLVTYNWGKDWDVPTVISQCEKAGFGGVELRSTHKHGVEITLNAVERREVRQKFASSAVELVGLGSACEYHAVDAAVVKKNIEETKAFIRLCHDVGGSGVKVRPNGLPAGVPVEKTLEQIGQSLREVAAYGADYNIAIRVEVHGRGTASLPHIRTMMDVADHPNALVCWNCNPTDLDGEGLEHNFQLVQSRINTVHIHDLRNDNYPWTRLFGLLKGIKFSGWALLEEGAAPADIPTAMLENRRLFDALAG